ncbi:putative amino acid/polyamine transporter I, cationic amino acid transporter [Helianthus annuus]|uniref:Amino acid/polyamine transporter I, cationic amino acid transporter n=1 Tax=Helianthus annuus TaxID=4232 RepID=A0A9K3IM61_HELAN|nr:cationic amino acid transporter 2, vacuolar-like [Helianthus annuus]KAF5799368.1 putative amino acid/polyamine transporter I, cationic amino acid transporter [Helianthus annuus]KAJ0563784.1 putative amino acid/polyamine transporter I, cationic amino acid transporter [Helianthus annuus]KAJ0731860.1 putative amino acid/polyamine transporter I, cationic amino acid transporter [Helianthus annuus]KAJ0905439.1 putative amino acid/polyamine transporter I, cationic amino acid transporter [Helianthus
MGFVAESNQGANGGAKLGFKSLVRRKRVDSIHSRSSDSGHHQLAKELSILHLIAIGVGSTIGAGVYILVGTVAREHSGPALAFSFLIAGIAAALSAFCYAELASRCPSAGSAYHYSYICVGEGLAWIIGWALILEYTIGGSAVARGISPNLALLFGGPDSLPSFLARYTVPALGIVVDPCAAILVFVVTALLCVGIKESTFVQSVVTIANIFAMIFVILAGGYLGFKSGWTGYKLSSGYFPYGVDGMLAGASTVFFSYIGFDSVASTAEEVKNPQRDLPLGIGAALSICCMLYMLVSAVIVGLVPYYAMDPDTPISSAFASHGIQWAAYIITIGAVTALCSTLMGSLLPQPRILMAMARDGLLPSFFSEVNPRTQVPVKSTILTGLIAATLAFSMDVEQLAGMVSVGTLLAFTMVAISVLILRYVPPDEVPLPPSFQEAIDSVSLRYSNIISTHETDVEVSTGQSGVSGEKNTPKGEISANYPLIAKVAAQAIFSEKKRRKIAGWMIMLNCVGALILTYSASNIGLPSYFRLTLCGIGGLLLLFSLAVLTSIEQDDARHNFGHTGGFICPWVPLLPILSILINTYLLLNLGADTWMRVSVWLVIGVFVYVFYGRTHSSLQHAVYVPASHVDEIYQSSAESLPSE